MKIGIIGNGHMGQVLKKVIEREKKEEGFFVQKGWEKRNALYFEKRPDILIDFSHPDSLTKIIEYSTHMLLPVVLATTGYTKEQEAQIEGLAKKVPVLKSANFSLGILVMNRVLKELTHYLSTESDIEIIEAHHRYKQDAPSGTAKLLSQTIKENMPIPPQFIYGRKGMDGRKENEIGIHAIRGGNISGIHEVLFALKDENISLKHEAYSKEIFAKGALKGAKWLIQQEKGSYTMEDCLFGGN